MRLKFKQLKYEIMEILFLIRKLQIQKYKSPINFQIKKMNY